MEMFRFGDNDSHARHRWDDPNILAEDAVFLIICFFSVF